MLQVRDTFSDPMATTLRTDASSYLTGGAGSLIRCSPGDDATNGFFVCLFMRVTANPGSEDQPSLSTKRKHEADGLELEIPNCPSKKRKKRKKKKNTQSES